MKNGKLACLHRTESTGDLIREGKLAIGDGYRAKNRELSDEGIPFARAGNIDSGFHFEGADRFPSDELEKVGEKVSAPGDVVFTSKGTVGRFAYVRETTPRFVYSPQLCYWRSLDPDVIDSRWLFYWMQGGEFWLQVSGLKGQTDMADYVSLRDQRQMDITLPPIEEQRRIASILGSLDDKIEHNRRTAQALERLARAIFKAWFVDFEPVKAKAAGATSFPSMPQDVFDALPTTFVDTEIGPVPEGWGVKALSDVLNIVSGGTPKRSEDSYWNGDIPWYSVRDAPADGQVWVIDTEELITDTGLSASAARLVPKGCTIISARGTVGKLAMAGQPMTFNQSCYGLMPADEKSFNYLYLLVQMAVSDLQKRSHGSVFDTITRKTFDGVNTVAPERAAVDTFESMVSPLFERIFSSLSESRKLAALRNYLLPRFMSGDALMDMQGSSL